MPEQRAWQRDRLGDRESMLHWRREKGASSFLGACFLKIKFTGHNTMHASMNKGAACRNVKINSLTDKLIREWITKVPRGSQRLWATRKGTAVYVAIA